MAGEHRPWTRQATRIGINACPPKYFTPDLQHEIPRRLRERVMFGADYPLLTYERLISDWRGLGYSDEVLEKVFSGNAERFLSQVRNGGGMSK
jgi:predicted TIM-barrel fold metal-dependent hydrolase